MGHTIVIEMQGTLHFEGQDPFKEELDHLLKETQRDQVAKQIVFDMGELEFVGSCGISHFVDSLRDFNRKAPVRPVFRHVGSEFRRIMEVFDEEELFNFLDQPNHSYPRSKATN